MLKIISPITHVPEYIMATIYWKKGIRDIKDQFVTFCIFGNCFDTDNSRFHEEKIKFASASAEDHLNRYIKIENYPELTIFVKII